MKRAVREKLVKRTMTSRFIILLHYSLGPGVLDPLPRYRKFVAPAELLAPNLARYRKTWAFLAWETGTCSNAPVVDRIRDARTENH
jgi:hypothetical protein